MEGAVASANLQGLRDPLQEVGGEEVALEVTTRRLQVIKESIALCSEKKETEKVTGALVCVVGNQRRDCVVW